MHETNQYARQEQQCLGKHFSWKKLTINEFKTWLGIYYMMGIVQKPSLHSYWEKNKVTQTPGFAAIMTRDHFKSILRFLYFVNKEDELPKDHPNYNRLFKLRPFIQEIRRKFQQNYVPDREVSINETMVKFKGKKFFRQFLPSKPIRYGFKLFTLVESKTGYVWDFEVYTGKAAEAEQKHTQKVVLRLMVPLEGKGYRVFTDNCYSSPELFLTLEDKKIHACGTVRNTRKGLPKDIMDKKNRAVKALERGQSLSRQKGDLVAVTWQDRKVVHLISNVPVGVAVEKVNRKVKENGVWQNKEFDCPAVVKVYNKHMEGVDLGDQRIGYYKKHFKTSTWHLSLFFHTLEQSCLNAYIIEQATPVHQKRNRTILQFRNELGEQLIGG